MDGKYYNLWSTDNDKTDNNDDVVIKSVYDPSPVGYSLPASNAFTGFTTTGGNTWNSAEYNVKGGFDKGWYFYTKPNKKGDTFFFPINGCHYYNSGIISQVSINGLCLVAHPASDISDRHLNFTSEYIIPLGGNHRSWALALRSAEEKEENVAILQHLRFVFYYIQKRTSYISYLLYINYFVCYRFCPVPFRDCCIYLCCSFLY